MTCLDDNDAGGFIEGRLPIHRLREIEMHVDRCAACRVLVAELTKLITGPIAGHPGTELVSGATVGRYRIRDRIGSGGMGVVYRAHDPELDRDVALKLWSCTEDEEGARAALRREARALAQVCDRNVVAVFDAGEYEGEVFVAMELVEGVTLARWLSQRPRTWREIVCMFIDAGRGLAAVHAAGLIHGDFKPQNVLVGVDGRARVGDFGLAHKRSSARRHVAAGTPGFIAPEQRRGTIDARSDQYSYCVALAAALRTSSGVPRRIRAAIQRGLREDPEARFERTELLIAELESAIATARTRRSIGIGIGMAVTAALAIATWTIVRSGDDTRPPRAVSSLLARVTLGQAIGLADGERSDAALTVARRAADIAHRAGDSQTEADALYQLGVRQGAPGGATSIETLHASVRAAEAGGYDAGAARAWIMIALFTGFARRAPLEGDRWAGHAEASIERGGGDATLTLQLAVVSTMNAIANGEREKAEAQARAAVALAETVFGYSHVETARAHDLLGVALFIRGDRTDAIDHYRRAIAIATTTHAEDLPLYLANLGEAVGGAEGVALLERSLALQTAKHGPRHPYLINVLTTLARLHRDRHEYVAADRHARHALAIAESVNDDALDEVREVLESIRSAAKKR